MAPTRPDTNRVPFESIAMKKSALILAAVVSMTAMASAQAQDSIKDGWYGHSSLISLKASGQDNVSFKGNGASFVLGKKIRSGLSVEGQFFHQIDDGSKVITIDDTDFNASLKTSGIGLFARYSYSFGSIHPYARLGAVRSTLNGKLSDATGTSTTTDNEMSAAFGAGINYAINPKTYLNLDLTQYHNKSGNTITGASLGLGFQF